MFFLIAVVVIFGINASWWVISDWWLKRDLKQFPRARKLSRWALTILMALIFVPIIGMFSGRGNPLEYGPWVWAAFFYLWMGTIFFWMLGMTTVGLPLTAFSKIRQFIRKKSDKASLRRQAVAEGEDGLAGVVVAPVKGEGESFSELSLTRRQLLRLGLIAVPPVLAGGGAVASLVGRDNLQVYSTELPVKDLPLDLEGFTITQLSDIHVGLLTGRDRVERIIREANKLNSQLTVITGDLLDREFQYIDDLLETIGQLKAPLGVFICIGNHDKIENAQEWVRAVRKAGMNLLINQAAIVNTGGTPLKVLGVDYSREDYEYESFIRAAENDKTTSSAALKILLAHHPHAFDAASKARIPVTLAGHTHGGQIVLRAGENFEIFNPGRHLFRYVEGIYRSVEGNTLFVHKGSGDWFPLRTGAPTEVVQLRLVKG